MNADENRGGKLIGKRDPLLERDRLVRRARHFHLEPGAEQLFTRSQRDIEREGLLVSPRAGSSAILAAMAGIEHHGVDLLRAPDFVRSQDGLDDLGNVDHRDEIRVLPREEREIAEKAHAVDEKFARPALRANAAPLVPQRNGSADLRELREAIELRDIRKAHVIAPFGLDHFPVLSQRRRCHDTREQKSQDDFQ